MKTYKDIDAYIANSSPNSKKLLTLMRKTIHEAAPQATEAISYGIPTFKLNGNLIHFAAFKDHLSLFPGASGVATFEKELKKYKTSKGTIQFPLDKPLSLSLIKRITKFRAREQHEKGKK